jgi:hypothetical protein
MRVIFVVVVWALAAAGCEKTRPAGESVTQIAPVEAAAIKPGVTAQAATPATAPEDEAGEPMDDVDEAESPSDKSGAGDPSKAEGDGPDGEELDVEE